MTDTLSQRLIDIEQRLAHSERATEDLSAVVARQAAEIDLLNRKIEVLSRRLKDAAAQWDPSPQDSTPPPHY
ncbi:MAG: SlyX family protein [Alphaproteobacteria bacterium]